MNNEIIITQKEIESRIFTIRGVQVMLDSDLAEIYQSETKYINRATKRNPDRFPENFAFQLNKDEWDSLRFQTDTLKNENLKFQIGTSSTHGGRRILPFVFTEQGVAMLSAVLQTNVAISVSIQIINAFVEMRKIISHHSGLIQRIEGIEIKQIENDKKFEKIFNALESKSNIPTQGIFFEGQVFDAYEFTSNIIRTAKQNIILIDNYVDDFTLTHLTKKNENINVLIYTKNFNKQLQLDIQKVNEQYGDFTIKEFTKSHDRFLIIDNKEVYHLGASLKDLGKKWFAFSKMDSSFVDLILNSIVK